MVPQGLRRAQGIWRRGWALIAASGLLVIFTGCATTPDYSNMVWPDPPEKPRIKLVKVLKGESDLAGISIAEIIVGLRPKRGLHQPMGMAISEDSKRLYVSDFAWNVVFVFDLEKDELRHIGTDPRFPLTRPLAVALDAQENVYVADSWKKVVQVYGKDGQFLRRIGKDVLVKPTGLALDTARQRLYVVDTGHNLEEPAAHRIRVFDLEGKLVQEIGRRGNKDGEFNFPTYAALDSQGRLYVVDSANFRIQVFDREGKFLRKFGRTGDRPGDFSRPKGVAVDGFDNVYVVDSNYANVQIFNQKGELLLWFAGIGTSPGLLLNPATITISGDNTIYVSDSLVRRVSVYQLINTTAEDSFLAPTEESKGGETTEKGDKARVNPTGEINLKGKEVSKR
jgi:DNA-binding beta-propeller fold protein YncE